MSQRYYMQGNAVGWDQSWDQGVVELCNTTAPELGPERWDRRDGTKEWWRFVTTQLQSWDQYLGPESWDQRVGTRELGPRSGGGAAAELLLFLHSLLSEEHRNSSLTWHAPQWLGQTVLSRS